MAIQQINLGSAPSGAGGDTQRAANEKINQNFSNTTHAASRMVGNNVGNVLEVGAFGLGAGEEQASSNVNVFPTEGDLQSAIDTVARSKTHFFKTSTNGEGFIISSPLNNPSSGVFIFQTSTWNRSVPQYTYVSRRMAYNKTRDTYTFYSTQNVTKDGNGFLKGASPIIDLYDDHIELNHDAERQGGITFEKLGTGNYLIKGSLGFAQEGWYIEMPKDANGNVLVAVVYEQLENNDISVKTYAKRFDEETGDVVANLAKPRDIPTGRCINLRLHEVKEQLDEPIE